MPDPLARAALRFLCSAESGVCGVTTDNQSDCSDGQTKGSWSLGLPHRQSWLQAAAECLQLCSSCDRCHHISVSRNFADCSWYSACNTSALLKLGNHRSGRMTPRLRALVASATAEEHPESTPTIAPTSPRCDHSQRPLWNGDGSRQLPCVACPIDEHAPFLRVIVTHAANHRRVRDLLARDAGLPTLVFSDSDAGEPGFTRLEPHASNCSYADRNSIHGRGRECAKHWMGNNRGDALFLPAVLAAKVACAGRFDWLLVGDDDTHFCRLKLHSLLRPHVPTTPWYFGGRLDCAGEHCLVNATPTPRRASALAACPALVGGPPRRIRLGAFDRSLDVSLVRGDCPELHADAYQRPWAYGGLGHVLSAGLLQRASTAWLQRCIDRLVFGGCDMRVSWCFGMLGFPPALLGGAAYRDSDGVVGWSRYSSHRSASPTCSPLEPIMSRDEAEAPRECQRGGRSVRASLI